MVTPSRRAASPDVIAACSAIGRTLPLVQLVEPGPDLRNEDGEGSLDGRADGAVGIDFRCSVECIQRRFQRPLQYNRQLRDLIVAGRATPSFIVSPWVGLADAPEWYEKFDERQDGVPKVLLRP